MSGGNGDETHHRSQEQRRRDGDDGEVALTLQVVHESRSIAQLDFGMCAAAAAAM